MAKNNFKMQFTPPSLAVRNAIVKMAEIEGLYASKVVAIILRDVYRGKLKYKDGSSFFKEEEEV